MTRHLDRMIYIDDSGHPKSGLVVYGWIEFTPDHWNSALRNWLDTRKALWRQYGIPVTTELHTAHYVNGRGRIAKKVPDRHIHNGEVHWKDLGHEVARTCLETLRCTEGLRLGAVYRQDAPERLTNTKRDLYTALVARFEAELAADDSLAIIVMDGDGSDSSFRTTHRGLDLERRRVVEDAIHIDSRISQLVQMADLVAWTANAHVDKHQRNKFAWDWYCDYLAERDRHREPRKM